MIELFFAGFVFSRFRPVLYHKPKVYIGSLVSFLVGQSDTEICIPEKIEISMPEISSREDLLPFSFFEDFELFWNKGKW